MQSNHLIFLFLDPRPLWHTSQPVEEDTRHEIESDVGEQNANVHPSIAEAHVNRIQVVVSPRRGAVAAVGGCLGVHDATVGKLGVRAQEFLTGLVRQRRGEMQLLDVRADNVRLGQTDREHR